MKFTKLCRRRESYILTRYKVKAIFVLRKDRWVLFRREVKTRKDDVISVILFYNFFLKESFLVIGFIDKESLNRRKYPIK